MNTHSGTDLNWLKLCCVLLCGLVLQACVLTGNIGPVKIECRKGADEFKLELPMGSGREYPDGIQTQEGHPCGAMNTGPIEQGEDRSGGIFGALRLFLLGG